MFVDFLYELRERGVKVGAQEALSLSQALGKGLHETTLDGFYRVARALYVINLGLGITLLCMKARKWVR